jgi:hypothetical protein
MYRESIKGGLWAVLISRTAAIGGSSVRGRLYASKVLELRRNGEARGRTDQHFALWRDRVNPGSGRAGLVCLQVVEPHAMPRYT